MPGSSEALITLLGADVATMLPSAGGFFMADSCPAIAPVPVPRSSKALLPEATSLVFTTATM